MTSLQCPLILLTFPLYLLDTYKILSLRLEYLQGDVACGVTIQSAHCHLQSAQGLDRQYFHRLTIIDITSFPSHTVWQPSQPLGSHENFRFAFAACL